MKKIDKLSLIYINIITLFIIFYYSCFNLLSNIFIQYIIPIFWIVFSIITVLINNKFNIKKRVIQDNYQITFIIIITYLMIYFLSGIIFGYNKNINFYNLNTIIKNIFSILIVLISRELIRYNILNNSRRSKFIFIYTLFIFSIIDINLFTLINTSSLFKYICSVIIPSIVLNLLMNYLTLKTDYKTCLIYRIPICLFQILLPIVPNVNWFYKALFDVIIPFIIFIFIKRINEKNETSDNYINKFLYIKNIIIGIFIAIIISFFAGFLHYKPVVIMSNSMKNVFARGDIVIIEKLNDNDIESLKENDIIEYKLSNTSIIHRIIKINKGDNKLTFITKGDNNNTQDNKDVEKKQVLGKVKFSIPKIGYPSVYFKELINKK